MFLSVQSRIIAWGCLLGRRNMHSHGSMPTFWATAMTRGWKNSLVNGLRANFREPRPHAANVWSYSMGEWQSAVFDVRRMSEGTCCSFRAPVAHRVDSVSGAQGLQFKKCLHPRAMRSRSEPLTQVVAEATGETTPQTRQPAWRKIPSQVKHWQARIYPPQRGKPNQLLRWCREPRLPKSPARTTTESTRLVADRMFMRSTTQSLERENKRNARNLHSTTRV